MALTAKICQYAPDQDTIVPFVFVRCILNKPSKESNIGP